MDEARHVEAYKRLLHEKFDLAYPIVPPLQSLIDGILRDSRWDMTYLGMQVLIEGSRSQHSPASAMWQRIRSPLQ